MFQTTNQKSVQFLIPVLIGSAQDPRKINSESWCFFPPGKRHCPRHQEATAIRCLSSAILYSWHPLETKHGWKSPDDMEVLLEQSWNSTVGIPACHGVPDRSLRTAEWMCNDIHQITGFDGQL